MINLEIEIEDPYQQVSFFKKNGERTDLLNNMKCCFYIHSTLYSEIYCYGGSSNIPKSIISTLKQNLSKLSLQIFEYIFTLHEF